MARTPLYDSLAASGARFGEYRGAETAAGFREIESELEALRSGCGIYDLGWQSRMLVTGEDRQRWLNGMVTNNIRDDRKSTRLNSSHLSISYAVFCLTPKRS